MFENVLRSFSCFKPIFNHILRFFYWFSLCHTLVKMWFFDSPITDSPDLTSAGGQHWLTMVEPALHNIWKACLNLQLHGPLVIKLLLQDTHSSVLRRGQIVLSDLSLIFFQGVFKSFLVLLKFPDVFLISDSIFVDFFIQVDFWLYFLNLIRGSVMLISELIGLLVLMSVEQ